MPVDNSCKRGHCKNISTEEPPSKTSTDWIRLYAPEENVQLQSQHGTYCRFHKRWIAMHQVLISGHIVDLDLLRGSICSAVAHILHQTLFTHRSVRQCGNSQIRQPSPSHQPVLCLTLFNSLLRMLKITIPQATEIQ